MQKCDVDFVESVVGLGFEQSKWREDADRAQNVAG